MVPVQRGASFVHGARAFARSEEAQVFSSHDLSDGEAVVDLREVDVSHGDASHVIGLLRSGLGGR